MVRTNTKLYSCSSSVFVCLSETLQYFAKQLNESSELLTTCSQVIIFFRKKHQHRYIHNSDEVTPNWDLKCRWGMEL